MTQELPLCKLSIILSKFASERGCLDQFFFSRYNVRNRKKHYRRRKIPVMVTTATMRRSFTAQQNPSRSHARHDHKRLRNAGNLRLAPVFVIFAPNGVPVPDNLTRRAAYYRKIGLYQLPGKHQARAQSLLSTRK